ncbi:MAG: DNA-protecting protein DprA [Candidatus Doudnabacteria bacterium]|nr:DNA-protecting protein DprA [Candidatus Doudnabacteria bacterium]
MSILDETNKIFANALNLLPELGPARLFKLLNYFGDYQTAWKANGRQYQSAGLDPKTVSLIIPKKPQINPEREWDKLKQKQIAVILLSDAEYPPLLKEIPSPPPILYIRGSMQALKKDMLAVVGSRKMTLYGRQAINELAPPIVNSGLAIASGLAFGVDAEALSSCINAQGTPIAVLASSVDDRSISPKANFLLAQKIIKSGCLVSEYPLGTQVYKTNFPQRNRIISGMSIGTLVVEADLESGALITANYALEQNREVFALPGSIFSEVSRGTNKLIKSGAKLVASYQDILEELNISAEMAANHENFEETPDEEVLLSSLSRNPMHIDDLILAVKMAPAAVNSALTLLELKGRVKNLGGAKYVKIR